MPMTFTDGLVTSMIKHYGLSVQPGETAREVLAKHVENLGDFIEAQEIRTGRGWDEWDTADQLDLLKRRGIGKEKK